jgi:hypothetical protein
MKKRSISVILLILGIMCGVALADEFDPAVDGWYFSNWCETLSNPDCDGSCVGSCDFTWDLYRQAYLGINPTRDCVEAPLDCLYYDESFKNCAEGGNCGGISLLALALFKYGGYMGFCSPANFYAGTVGPDRDDLHQAINILQARCLAKGDYPVLSIANSFYGADAHTVIPYRVEENPSGYPPGTKIMYIWDPNHPYDDDPDHYLEFGSGFRVVLLCPHVQGSAQVAAANGARPCFRCAANRVYQWPVHRLFKPANDQDPLKREWETDEGVRLQGAFRWPWGESEKISTPELFFIRRPEDDSSPLTFTISGSRYKTLFSIAGNVIQIDAESDISATDVFRLSGTASNLSLEIATLGEAREFSIRCLRTGENPADWGSFDIAHLVVEPGAPVTITALGNLRALEVSSPDRELRFDHAVTQKVDEMVIARSFEELMTTAGKSLRIAPED